MEFKLIAVRPETKERIEKVAKEKKLKLCDVVDLAVKNYSGERLLYLDEETFKELEKIKRTLNLNTQEEAFLAVLTVVRVLFDKRLRFFEALKPIPELSKLIRSRRTKKKKTR